MDNLKWNLTEFQNALRSYQAASQKDFADTLNHAMRNIAYRAAQFTPATTAAAIRAELRGKPNLVYALTIAALKRRGLTSKLGKGELQEAVAKFISRRASSARYLRSFFAQAVVQLGGNWRGRTFPGGTSGFANRATPSRLAAEIVGMLRQPDSGHAGTAEAIGREALEQAFAFVTKDLMAYVTRKMQITARAHSG